MEGYAKNFVRAGLIYFFFSAVIGLGMIVDVDWSADYLQIHVHFMLLGWMSMLIFGVGYHIIPRFQGHAQIPSGLAWTHFYIANIGLLSMGYGWWTGQGFPDGTSKWILLAGGILTVAGFLIFLLVMLRGLVPVKHDDEE